jgi:hypothetical protein
MTEKSKAPEKLGAWKSLRAHQKEVSKKSLRELFAKSRNRADRFSAEACGIRLDYSRHLATRKTVRLLTRLAREAGVGDLRDRMFAGEHINTTEDRAVLHVALRACSTWLSGRADAIASGMATRIAPPMSTRFLTGWSGSSRASTQARSAATAVDCLSRTS